MKRSSSAFTLVELLVVIAIIGILIALLLPAVQAAREAARRTQCANHLKQLALATLNYHEALLRLPPANSDRKTGIAGYTGSQMHWMARILPYLEQQSIYDLIDWSEFATNPALRSINLSVARCPSDARGPYPGKNNYVACVGNSEVAWNPASASRGAIYINSNCSLADIRDGASNTLFASECRVNFPWVQDYSGDNTGYTSCKAGTHGTITNNLAGAQGRGASWNWGHSVEAWAFTTLLPPNDATFVGKKECILWSTAGYLPARSAHPGGVMVALYDGSVRMASESIDINLWRRLGAIADGQVVASW